MNRTSMQRGMAVSTTLKKYSDTITKNTATGQDDIFMKPDRNKVTGMMDSNYYNKLNDKGYVPEESVITNGDVIIGKVSRIQAGSNTNKLYKDESEIYKSTVDGTVDKVYTGIYNSEGYEMYNMRIRSERNPMIGDKLCSRHGQKGTCGILLHATDMPFTESGIQPDIIINPCCIPSRMTIGQLFECVFSKVASLRGEMIDATPFNNFDFNKITDELKSYGFNEHGYEHLYCGMTGKKILSKIFIGPTFYLRLKHMVQDKIHCLTLDHDVLTKSGWKKYNELTMDDEIATLNKDTDTLEYNKPNNILYYENYNGQMYKIKNSNVDLNVTTNHRMLVSKPFGRKCEWLKYDYEFAGDIIGKHRRYKKDANWETEDFQFELPSIIVNSIEAPAIQLDMDAWLSYLGIWIAEGWTNSYIEGGHYTVTIASNKQRVKDKLLEVIPKLGYNYKDEKNKNVIHSKQLWSYLSQFSLGAPNKFLPDWVMNLSQRQTRILIESMVLGDGTYLKGNTNRYAYYTSSIKLADQFQQLCLHAGWASNISIHHKAGNSVIIEGRNVISNYDLLRLSVIKDKNKPMVNHSHVSSQNIQEEEIYDYNGPVFCLEVPNETFYVRRNGIPVWTANSRATGPRQRLTRQPPEGITAVIIY